MGSDYQRPAWEDVLAEADAKPTLAEQIQYLKQVRKEDKLYVSDVSDSLMHDPFADGTSFRERLKIEIEHRQELLEQKPDASGPDAPPAEWIRWKGSKTDLVYLFQRLRQEGFLTYGFKAEPWKQLRAHFTDADGNELKNLRQTWEGVQNNKSGKSRRGDDLDDIISDTKRRGEQ